MSLRVLRSSVLRKQPINSIICSSTRCCGKVTKVEDTEKDEMKSPWFKKMKAGASKAYEIVTRIKDGMRDTVQDLICLSKITASINSRNDMIKLNLRELELLYEFNPNMRRAIPVLILGILPFGNCLAIPIVVERGPTNQQTRNFAKKNEEPGQNLGPTGGVTESSEERDLGSYPAIIKYPRRFLIPQFWTDEQKVKFTKMDHEERVQSYVPVLSELHDMHTFEKFPKWKSLLDELYCGKTPSYDDLIQCSSLFKNGPFCLEKLSPTLVEKLMRMHNMRAIWKMRRLIDKAHYFLFADKYIRDNGGPNVLPLERLQKCCLHRGVNAFDMTEEEMQSWLSDWVKFTDIIDGDMMSLVLIAPALVTLNHPSNASLVFNHQN